jgi:uncharacterized membrane protein YdjX (TVP38/TMEM64 family)
MKLTGHRAAWMLAAGVVGCAAFAALAAGHADAWGDRLEDALEQRGLVAGLMLYTLAALVGTLLMVPAWIFPIAAGAAFGFGWGAIATLVAQAIAAQCAFLTTRHALRKRVERAARRRPSFVAMDKAVKREPWKMVALLRLAPGVPSGLKSYLLGLTCVGAADYATASAAGMLPGMLLKTYVGAAGRDALSSGGPMKWALLAAGIAATLGVALWAGRAARLAAGL